MGRDCVSGRPVTSSSAPSQFSEKISEMHDRMFTAPDWLVVIDNGPYETLTYFLNRVVAELWQHEHGGRLYEREYEPPYWRAAKP